MRDMCVCMYVYVRRQMAKFSSLTTGWWERGGEREGLGARLRLLRRRLTVIEYYLTFMIRRM